MRAFILALLAPLLLQSCASEDKPRGQVEANTTSEIDERLLIAARVKAAYAVGDFRALNEMAHEFRTRRSRTPSGTWKLSWFYRGLPGAIRTAGKCLDPNDPVLTDWRLADPDQPAPYIAKAWVHISYAFCVRGGGYGHEVSPAAWRLFNAHIAAARAVLEENKEVASTDPQFYAEMMKIYMAQGRWGWAFKSLLDEATEREPYYYDLYFSAVQYYLPQWHGDRGDIDWLGRYAAKQTTGEGLGVYARVLWSLNEFADADLSEMDWPTAKQGMEDVLRDFPDAWNAANFARIACRMKDREAAASFFSRAPYEDGTAWGKDPAGLAEWKGCRAFAQQGPPRNVMTKYAPPGWVPSSERSARRCPYAIWEKWSMDDFRKHCNPRAGA